MTHPEGQPGFEPQPDAGSGRTDPARASLETNDELLRLMVDSLRDYALYVLDDQGRVLTWNPGAQRIMGYRAEEIVGRSREAFRTPEDRAAGKPEAELREAVRTGRSADEGWRVRQDGTRLWASVVVTALRDGAGTLRGFATVMRDMTERRLAEQAIRDTAAQLQGVINAAVDGIIAIDERGLIEWVNPAALRIFGYSREELIGQNVKVLMPEPYHSEHDRYLANYRETGQARIIGIGREVKGRRKSGDHFPVDLAVSEVKLGTRRLFTGIVRDITQRKEAERLLVEAKEAAEAASTAKDQFLAMVSHELRTPLNPILAAVTFLEGKPDLDPEVREEITAIRRNVEHEAQIVDDLLNLTRLARGKIELHHEIVDAHALLRGLLGEFAAEIDGKSLAVATALRAKDRFVWGDPHRLRQVLTNLLHNAIKFTEPGGQVNLQSRNAEEGYLRIEISDTGMGIDPEVLPRLFSPFEQGEPGVTRRYGGLGLGLAISKGIVDLHGGKLTAASEGRGRGATFLLELATVPAVPETKDAAGAPAGAAGRRVLLVEDHQDTMRVMMKLLRALGYSVAAAGTVHEALRLAEQEHFDVLVCDIGLPDGSGLEVMRKIHHAQAIPGIAVSGFGQPEDLSRSREAGFIDHLIKPVNFNRLAAVLRQLAKTN